MEEYYKNTLIFEGEYINGERNGKAKEYHKIDGKLIFEGEYLEGKNGKVNNMMMFWLLLFERKIIKKEKEIEKVKNTKKMARFEGEY